ncbi:MAG TPA: DUF1127 domain-containing protein [Hyphomicrobiaceae bacterium]|jgi:uncharacterized protein YjiS (DUF1127 family)|nr:DUF1127 domain-containing protein [Hyphomicrobiaceae bacterium]
MSKFINSKGAAALSPLTGRSRVRSSLIAGARWLAAGLAKELAARRAMRSLASLDDRMLRDIGLERGQIDYAVRQGRQAARRVDDARSDLIRWT